MPDCVSGLSWGKELGNIKKKKKKKKTLESNLCELDEEEFDVFLAQLVIKASGKGVVGKDLTGTIELMREWRNK